MPDPGDLVTETPLGWLAVAAGPAGVRRVVLADGAGAAEAALAPCRDARDPAASRAARERIAHALADGTAVPDLPRDVRGTAFQHAVWDALAAIPAGETRTYGQLAAALGRPRAHRAVAGACAANPVALLIPCHRVVPRAGGVGGYRWGAARKRALLAREAARIPA